MKIHCTVCVVNRLLPNLSANVRKRPVKSTLALCKQPTKEEYCIILFSGQNKTGTKYPLNGNIKQILTRFINEGKCTIQLKNPEHDLGIQAEVIQLKGFLHLLKRAVEGKVSSRELTLSSMSVTPIKPKDIAPTKVVVSKRSDYPSRGFPRTLEYLYINDIQRCSLDKGILQLSKLKILNLNNNLIESLPEELNKLPNLRELCVAHNLLGKSSLKQWQWIGGFLSKNLVMLDLSYNELTIIPDQLVKLHHLRTLNLCYNNLKTLPVGIGNLRNLKIFSVSNNCLTILPGSVRKLRLQSIDISRNNFGQSIPKEAGVLPKPLQVGTLKEYAARKVLWSKVPYSKGSLPLSLIDFLDYAKYCVCGQACFTIYWRLSCYLSLSNISETVNTAADESSYVPIDCYFCNIKCLSLAVHNRNRHPIVR